MRQLCQIESKFSEERKGHQTPEQVRYSAAFPSQASTLATARYLAYLVASAPICIPCAHDQSRRARVLGRSLPLRHSPSPPPAFESSENPPSGPRLCPRHVQRHCSRRILRVGISSRRVDSGLFLSPPLALCLLASAFQVRNRISPGSSSSLHMFPLPPGAAISLPRF